MVFSTTMAADPRLLKFLQDTCAGDILLDEPLSMHTWYRIGGPADVVVFLRSSQQISAIVDMCASTSTPVEYLGEGANVLASDEGFRGVVISLTRHLVSMTRDGTRVSAAAGATLRNVVYFCEQQGLRGVQFLAGIPGTIGGALIMNAGIDDGAIGDAVASVSVLGGGGGVQTIEGSSVGFAYRSAPVLQNKAVLGCTLSLTEDDPAQLRQYRLDLLRKRAAGQPLEYPSCGSVFKRPPGHYVGKMVEEAGLKGLRHGDAMISEKHAGFIVNLGSATASDIMYLIQTVRDAIDKKFDVALELEVRLLGAIHAQ
jgi:UDP-N-acetylmuramate dehydrogenase